jgi:hypothetical protein
LVTRSHAERTDRWAIELHKCRQMTKWKFKYNHESEIHNRYTKLSPIKIKHIPSSFARFQSTQSRRSSNMYEQHYDRLALMTKYSKSNLYFSTKWFSLRIDLRNFTVLHSLMCYLLNICCKCNLLTLVLRNIVSYYYGIQPEINMLAMKYIMLVKYIKIFVY